MQGYMFNEVVAEEFRRLNLESFLLVRVSKSIHLIRLAFNVSRER